MQLVDDKQFTHLADVASFCEPPATVVPAIRSDRASNHDSRPALSEHKLSRREAFARHINPHLADLLGLLNLDKCFVTGEGCRLWDEEGHAYLDCIAAYGALPLGSNPEPIWQAITEVRQARRPSLCQPSALDMAGRLAERLVELAPGDLNYVTFANSGAEAVEAAIKMCRLQSGRTDIIATHNSFHGKTLGALAATGNKNYQDGCAAPTQHVHHIAFGDIVALEEVLGRHSRSTAAVLVEPIQGEGGIVEPDVGYLSAVRELCDRFGVLLIFDEIQTGLGRTGTMFACQQEAVVPDVMTLAKALGGGLVPIGAVLANDRVFSKSFALKHSSTFAGNTLAASAGLAMLDVLTDPKLQLIPHVDRLGRRLKRGLASLQEQFPHLIKDVRGRGFLLGIEVVNDRSAWSGSLLGVAAEQSLLAPLMASYLLNIEGIRVAPTLNGRAVIRIEPPLTMTWDECEELLSGLQRTLEAFHRGNTGEIIESILKGKRIVPPINAKPSSHSVNSSVQPLVGEKRFAFLLHPLDFAGAGEFDPQLGWLPTDRIEDIAQRLTQLVEPFVLSQARIQSATGETIHGEFIVVPKTAEQLAELPRVEAEGIVRHALAIAEENGAEIVGLGAFTSVVTRGGKSIAGTTPLTTGNSYTAVACSQGIRIAMDRLGQRRLNDQTAAIVGATGAIGRSMAGLLAEDVQKLILIGNPTSNPMHVRRRLDNVAATLCREVLAAAFEGVAFAQGSLGDRVLKWMESSIQDFQTLHPGLPAEIAAEMERVGAIVLTQDSTLVSQADIVVTATSATDSLVGPADLKHQAVVCDLSRPHNISREVARLRPDVMVIDGGVIRVPGVPDLGNFGLGRGHAFACMAETMLLTFAGHFQDTSLGSDLSPMTLRMLRRLADEHGFEIGGLRCFGERITSADWQRVQDARQLPSRPSH